MKIPIFSCLPIRFLFLILCLSALNKGLFGQSVSIDVQIENQEDSVCQGDPLTLIAKLDSADANFSSVSFVWLVELDQVISCSPTIGVDPCLLDSSGFIPLGCLSEACLDDIEEKNDTLTFLDSNFWRGINIRVKALTAVEEDLDTLISESFIPPIQASIPLDTIRANPPDAKLCSAVDSLSVSLIADKVACGFTLRWYDQDPSSGDVDPIEDSEGKMQIEVNAPGTYFAREEKDDSTREAVSFTIAEEVGNSLSELTPSPFRNEICSTGDTLSLSADAVACGFILHWYLGDPEGGEADTLSEFEGLMTISILEKGTYYAREENEEGVGQTRSFSVDLRESISLDSLNSDADEEGICQTDSVTLTANSVACGFVLKWYASDPNNSDPSALPDSVGELSISILGPGIYYAREETEDGNMFGETRSIEIEEEQAGMPLAGLDPSDTVVCSGENVNITAMGIDTTIEGVVLWFEDGVELEELRGEDSITINPNSNTIISATLEGCVTESDTVSSSIGVEEGSQIRLTGSEMDVQLSTIESTDLGEFVDGATLEFTLSSEAPNAEFEWACIQNSGLVPIEDSSLMGSNNEIILKPMLKEDSERGTITCTIENNNDPCEGEFTIEMEIKGFTIPNILTPNGDDENDTWDLREISDTPQAFTVKVFSRQGSCVYGCDTEQTLQTPFEGEDCPDGPYWYLIEGPDGFERKGALTILRN